MVGDTIEPFQYIRWWAFIGAVKGLDACEGSFAHYHVHVPYKQF